MTDWKRAAKRRMIAPLVVLVVGIVMLVVGGIDTTLGIVGSGVIAAAFTIAIALVFLEVGLSEDRERTGDERADPRPRP